MNKICPHEWLHITIVGNGLEWLDEKHLKKIAEAVKAGKLVLKDGKRKIYVNFATRKRKCSFCGERHHTKK